jgi:hypothetical protein
LFTINKPHQETTEKDVWMAFERLTPGDKEKFLHLRDNGFQPFRYLSDAMHQNSFHFHNHGRFSAQGLFPLLSRFNHSCAPNSKIPNPESDRESLAIFAVKDIAAGEEITFCYRSDFFARTLYERHRLLQFTCNCEACHAGIVSDLRRTLIRGLLCLIVGKDVDGERRDSTLPYSIDPEIKRVAEESALPLSSRLVYILLALVLSEEEGLEDFMAEIMLPELRIVSEGFATGSNAKIAKIAMAQGTWREKFCVAAGLYGRKDAADVDIATMMRAVRGLCAKR